MIDLDNNDFDLYQYSKLMEFESNVDLASYLINYFKDKITPFNGNVESLKELYCLVKACNYFKSREKNNRWCYVWSNRDWRKIN